LKPAKEKCGLQMTIDVDGISVKLEEIEKAGGKIILGKTEIPGGHGVYACFHDPTVIICNCIKRIIYSFLFFDSLTK
jgi:predicted enzyme related to lactoylglutathione lyase